MLKKEIGIDDLFVLYEDNPPHPMEKAALSEVLWRLCKTRETPRVFIGGEYIGGWEGRAISLTFLLVLKSARYSGYPYSG